MPLLELKGYGVSAAGRRLIGVDLTLDEGAMLAIVGRRDSGASLLALGIAGLLPAGATSEGTLSFTGKRVGFIDATGDVAALDALLADGADLIVAVEPGRARDPAAQLALLEALQAANAERRAAVLIFTADFRLALSMGLEVAVLSGGKLLLRAPSAQIAELPQHDTVRNLVGGERIRTRTLMRPPIGEPLLELHTVTKAYRQGLPWFTPEPEPAIKGVGFAVRRGEVVGLLGLAASGKSLLLRMIAGLERPSSGRIGMPDTLRGQIGFVFSDPRRAFNPALPVGLSLTEPLRVEQTLLIEDQADRLVEVVRAVGLAPDLLARLPGQLGVAELQRLALARGLVGRPGLLLLDDPTVYLDPAEAREFLVYFARVRADFGLTAIIASREFEALKAVTDRLLVLDDGHIIEGGKPGELVDGPKQELTRRLVSPRYPTAFRRPDERLTTEDERPKVAEPPPEPKVDAPAPEPAVSVPEPAATPSADSADKAAEGGEAQLPVDRLVDAAGSADAPNPEPAR